MASRADDVAVRRLVSADAERVVACFRRVYGGSYANPLFYDAAGLARRLADGSVRSVGAVASDGRIVGHMAMTSQPGAASAELGNTVVDPAARGGGVAWRVGAELIRWCAERGHAGFLHYPTTDPIMQRQSVKGGFELGLMLGYIPAATDGKVGPPRARLRQAATIVYQPLAAAAASEAFLPAAWSDWIRERADACGLRRHWRSPQRRPGSGPTRSRASFQAARDLRRLSVARAGSDADRVVAEHAAARAACSQIDLSLSDPGLEAGVAAAREAGYVFCGWLPGLHAHDVLRLQRPDAAQTDLVPGVVNPVAQALLRALGGAGRTRS